MSRPVIHLVKRLAVCAAFGVLACSQNACVHQTNRQLSPGCSPARVSNMRSFYVRQHALDDHQLAEAIATQLRQRGKQALHGTAQRPSRGVDAVITYQDKWMWDITMYMLSLDVQLREPGTDVVLATAKTVRTSLVRKSQDEMVRETLQALFDPPTQ